MGAKWHLPFLLKVRFRSQLRHSPAICSSARSTAGSAGLLDLSKAAIIHVCAAGRLLLEPFRLITLAP